MIKAIFFDIDGTLVSHTKNQVSASTRNALAILKEKGIRRIIATGRHLSEIDSLPMEGLDFDGYLMLNGQLCYDEHKRLVAGNPLVGEQKDILLQIFEARDTPIMLIEQDKMYINFVNERVRLAQQSVSAWMPQVQPYTGGTIYQAVAFITPEEKALLCSRLTGCRISQWMELAVDIVPAHSGKAAAIAKYLDRNRMTKEQIMAFGDGNNDVDMLQFAGIGIAMGNAEDRIRAAADYVTDHIDENGIYNALKHFQII